MDDKIIVSVTASGWPATGKTKAIQAIKRALEQEFTLVNFEEQSAASAWIERATVEILLKEPNQ